jgi:hypothetical protein
MMITPRHNQFDAVAPISHIKVQAAGGRRHACRRYGPAAELGSDFTDTRQLTLALVLHLFSSVFRPEFRWRDTAARIMHRCEPAAQHSTLLQSSAFLSGAIAVGIMA